MCVCVVRLRSEPGVVAHTCHPSTQEAEAGGSLRDRDQPGLQSKLKASLDCIARPCLKKTKKKEKKRARLKFPIDYPYSPPAFRFLTKMWHPNIYETGDVCISILHPPVDDPQSGELPSERWNPTQNVRTILLSVISLLNEPNTFSPANVDASVMYRKWKESKGKDREYTDIIRKQVLGTKVDAERDGVKVPTTLAEYCVKSKAPVPEEGPELFYEDDCEDGSCLGDEDSSESEGS
ncbi:ubiquitin-conjugating enzyme E2 R1 isoform X1 [Cavia porcellus]|uniref:ubiquitin-conjugating enzyme E2 R1 isoform X1 n=1 Tax=Cavia porcellus TaxID=10141 RepID=UPI002FE17BB3